MVFVVFFHPQEFIDRFWQSPHGSTKEVYKKIAGLAGVIEGMQGILGGPEYLKAHPILPHIRTPLDVEVNLDSSSKPMRMDSTSSGVSSLNTKTEMLKDNIQRLAVLFSPKAHYRLRSRDLLGVHVMKRRQLRKIGYRIVEVSWVVSPHILESPLTFLNLSTSIRSVIMSSNHA